MLFKFDFPFNQVLVLAFFVSLAWIPKLQRTPFHPPSLPSSLTPVDSDNLCAEEFSQWKPVSLFGGWSMRKPLKGAYGVFLLTL